MEGKELQQFLESSLVKRGAVAAQCVIQPCLLDACIDLTVLVRFPDSVENEKHTVLSLCESRIMLKPQSIYSWRWESRRLV